MARGELTPTPVFGATLKTAWRGQLLLSPFSVALSLAPCLSFSFPPSANLLLSISTRAPPFSGSLRGSLKGPPRGLREDCERGKGDSEEDPAPRFQQEKKYARDM